LSAPSAVIVRDSKALTGRTSACTEDSRPR